MGYRDIYKESNEQAEERFSLVMERIAEIAEETDVPEKFDMVLILDRSHFEEPFRNQVTLQQCGSMSS